MYIVYCTLFKFEIIYNDDNNNDVGINFEDELSNF